MTHKHIAQKVTELIREELVKGRDLEEGAVCWNCEKDERKYGFVSSNKCCMRAWNPLQKYRRLHHLCIKRDIR